MTEAYVKMRRETIREGLHQLYIPFYDALCEELENTFWCPYSGLRTIEDQKKIYAIGRTTGEPGRTVTNARPGLSAHNWGCATDWCEMRPEFTGREVWNNADWKVYERAVKKVSLRWGGDFKKFVDKPHNELILHVSWKEVGMTFERSGEKVALDLIWGTVKV